MDMPTRRAFFASGRNVLGSAALASLLGNSQTQAAVGTPVGPHYAARAKRVIYLHMVGGPSQIDLFDYKPGLDKLFDKELPD